MLDDDSLSFASLGSSHLGLKMPGQEQGGWEEWREGEKVQGPPVSITGVAFRYLMYQAL